MGFIVNFSHTFLKGRSLSNRDCALENFNDKSKIGRNLDLRKDNIFLITFKILLLILSLTVVPNTLFAQTVTNPIVGEVGVNEIPAGETGGKNNRDVVDAGSPMTFDVPAETNDVGGEGGNKFIWVVYGGTIKTMNGDSPQNVVTSTHDGNTVHKIEVTGMHPLAGGEQGSSIVIDWQDKECETGYILVKQVSAHGCTDDKFSVYYVNISKYKIEMLDVADVCEGDPFKLQFKIQGFKKNAEEKAPNFWMSVKETFPGGYKTYTIRHYGTENDIDDPNFPTNNTYTFNYYTDGTKTVHTGSNEETHRFEITGFKVLVGDDGLGGIHGKPIVGSSSRDGTVKPAPETSDIRHN